MALRQARAVVNGVLAGAAEQADVVVVDAAVAEAQAKAAGTAGIIKKAQRLRESAAFVLCARDCMKWRASAAFLTVGVLWGSAWILTSSLPEPAMLAGAAKFGISAVLLGIATTVVRVRGRRKGSCAGRIPIVASLVLGITLAGLPFACAVWSRETVSAGMVAVLYALMPLAALLLEGMGSSLTGAIPALVIGAGGVAFLAGQGIAFSLDQFGGVLLLGGAVVLGAWSLTYARKRILRGTILASTAIQCGTAAVLLLFLSGTGGTPFRVRWAADSVMSLTALAAAEGAIAFPLLFVLLAEMEAWQAASLQWMATLVAMAEAGFLLRARPTLQMGAGTAMILGAIVWVMRSGGQRGEADAVTLKITSAEESANARAGEGRG